MNRDGRRQRKPAGEWPFTPLVRELRAVLAHEDGVEAIDDLDLSLLPVHPGVLRHRPSSGPKRLVRAVKAALTEAIRDLGDPVFEDALLWHFAIAEESSLGSAKARRARAIELSSYSPDAYAKERRDKKTGEWRKSRLTRALERIERHLDDMGNDSGGVDRPDPLAEMSTPTRDNRLRAVILCALEVEYAALRSVLNDIRSEEHRNLIYEVGVFAGSDSTWEVLLYEAGQGNKRAAVAANTALSFFTPSVAMFVGVAGAVKASDVVRGDVVLASKIYDYHSGKDAEEFRPRPEVDRTSPLILEVARSLRRSSQWQRLVDGVPPESRVHIQAIASGEQVVVHTESAAAQIFTRQYEDTYAVEKEGAGFLEAAREAHGCLAAVVRGISDHLVDKTPESDIKWQPVASAAAASFAYALLDRLGASGALQAAGVEAPDPPEAAQPVRERPSSRGKILYVENDEIFIDIVEQALSDFEVVSETTLGAALAYLMSHADSLSLVLVDANLTDLDDRAGYEVLQYLTDHCPDVPRILITGSRLTGGIYARLFERYGLFELIGKDENFVPDLRSTVSRALKQ